MTFSGLQLPSTPDEANKEYLLCSLQKVGKTLLQALFKHPDSVGYFWNRAAIKSLTFQTGEEIFYK